MEEVYLTLDSIRNHPGFALDIGGTLGKLAYRPKSLYISGEIQAEDKVRDEKFGPLFLRLFDKDDIPALIKYVKEECDLTIQPGQEIFVAGISSSAAKQQIEEAFDVVLKVRFEYEFSADAISFLHQNLGPEEVFLPEPPGAREEAVRRFRIFQSWIRGRRAISRAKWDMEQDEEEALSWRPDPNGGLYPFLIVVGGSMFSLTKVSANGSVECVNMVQHSGKYIMGLLATLTGERDFDMLIKMAEESDGRTTNIYGYDLTRMKQEQCSETEVKQKNENAYVMTGDLLVFPFGKPASSEEEVKKGDMVHSVFETAVINLALVSQMTALIYGCKNVFFAGNFMSTGLIREWLAREMIRKNLESPAEKRLNFRFIRHGGYISCIGAYLTREVDNSRD